MRFVAYMLQSDFTPILVSCKLVGFVDYIPLTPWINSCKVSTIK